MTLVPQRLAARGSTEEFARLSGDYNPLHMDAVTARRTTFGETVHHGVHVLMTALDHVFGKVAGCIELQDISASFHAPLPTSARFEVEIREESEERLEFVLVHDLQKIQTVKLTYSEIDQLPEPNNARPGPADECIELSFEEASRAEGLAVLSIDQHTLRALFPNLNRAVPGAQCAALVAATRIVGMQCPGLHSVFVKLKLEFGPKEYHSATELNFRTSRADQKSSYLEISLQGSGIAGVVSALYRPRPVDQATYSDIKSVLKSGEFGGQRALIIGGSRGLGEVTAKSIAAGGGDACITYRSGSLDAQKIVDEIAAHGGRCRAFRLDVRDIPDRLPEGIEAGWVPSHLYYFATPKILPNKSGAWDAAISSKFLDYYVAGLKETVAAVYRFWSPESLDVIYPSSVYIDDEEPGMAEYGEAKLKGEQLGAKLQTEFAGLTFLSYRLNAVDTDQTQTFWDLAARPALPEVLTMLRR